MDGMFGIVVVGTALALGGLGWWVRRTMLGQEGSKQRAREKFDREREADRLACLEAERSIVGGPGGGDEATPARARGSERARAAAERWKAANSASPFDDDLPVP